MTVFFFSHNTVTILKNKKIVSYTGHENTQICKMTEDFMASVFTKKRRRIKTAFIARKMKILSGKRGSAERPSSYAFFQILL